MFLRGKMKQAAAFVFCIFIFAAGIGYAGGKGDSKFPGQSGGYLKKDPMVKDKTKIYRTPK